MVPEEPSASPDPGHFEASAALVGGLVRAGAFWTAICFPLAYAGLYVVTATHLTLDVVAVPLVAGLLVANVLAVLLGHRHTVGDEDGSTIEQASGSERPRSAVTARPGD